MHSELLYSDGAQLRALCASAGAGRGLSSRHSPFPSKLPPHTCQPLLTERTHKTGTTRVGWSGCFQRGWKPLETLSLSLSPWTYWADLRKTSLSWHQLRLQGPLQCSLLATLLWIRSLLLAVALELDASVWLCLRSLSPCPSFPLPEPCPPVTPLEADTSGASSFPY